MAIKLNVELHEDTSVIVLGTGTYNGEYIVTQSDEFKVGSVIIVDGDNYIIVSELGYDICHLSDTDGGTILRPASIEITAKLAD